MLSYDVVSGYAQVECDLQHKVLVNMTLVEAPNRGDWITIIGQLAREKEPAHMGMEYVEAIWVRKENNADIELYRKAVKVRKAV